MRVAVDATSLLGHVTGVGVMTRELLRGLGARPDMTVSGFAMTWRGRGRLSSLLPAGVTPHDRPMAARPLRQIWSRSDLAPIEWWTGPVDVVHGPNFVVPPSRRACRVLTIHDLTFVRYPELCTADTLAYPPLIERAVAGGAWVHAVSGFVAEEVIDHFDVPPERVVVVPNGLTPTDPDGGDAGRGRQLAGANRYILAIGTIEPRKDHPTLVRAFEAMSAELDLHLVLAGPEGWGSKALDTVLGTCSARARNRIHRLGWVDDRQRADLLAGAAVLAYPSLYEGFGLVPLEAMAAGIPVVTTRVGALPETVGEAALLVPPGDAEALAEALTLVITDPVTASELIEAGHSRSRQFGWPASIAGVVQLYRSAVSGQ